MTFQKAWLFFLQPWKGLDWPEWAHSGSRLRMVWRHPSEYTSCTHRLQHDAIIYLLSIIIYRFEIGPVCLFVHQLNFLHWISGEPNNKGNIESCAEFRMYYWDESGSWNDVHCESYNDWLCEIRAGRRTPEGYFHDCSIRMGTGGACTMVLNPPICSERFGVLTFRPLWNFHCIVF